MEILRQFQTAVFDDFHKQGKGSTTSFWGLASVPNPIIFVTIVEHSTILFYNLNNKLV